MVECTNYPRESRGKAGFVAANSLKLPSCIPGPLFSTAMLRAIGQFLCNVLIQYFSHRERNDDHVLTPEERINFRQRITRKVEAHKKAFPSPGAHHRGRKLVDVRDGPRGPFA